MSLSGNERWVKSAINEGAELWVRKWADDWWWPVYDIELDCELIRIDVMNRLEILSLGDIQEIRIGIDEIIEQDNFYEH